MTILKYMAIRLISAALFLRRTVCGNEAIIEFFLTPDRETGQEFLFFCLKRCEIKIFLNFFQKMCQVLTV